MGANGIHLMVVGSTEPTPLQIGDETFILRFIVVEELVAMAILGSDFLMNNEITLDFGAMILKPVNCNIPLMSHKVNNDTILLHVQEDTYISNQQDVRCQAQLHHKDSRRLAKDGHYLYKPNGFLWGITSEEEIPLTLVRISNSRLNIPVGLYKPTLQLFLPADFVMGSLHNVIHLINTILSKLTLEEKHAKVFGELKIDDNEQLDGSTKEKLKSLISEFLDVFSENKFDLGSADLLEAEINLNNGDRPIVEPYRRPPVHLLSMVAQEIEHLLDAGVIRESQSPFNTATVIVKKPDGTVRLCIDYRSLNKHTIAVTAPLPPLDLDMITSQVGGKKFYSKMDLIKGYYAVRIKEEHIYKTAWSILGLGAYEFVRLPLGLKNSPSYFCQLLNRLFRGLDHHKCFVYRDDILTSSNDIDDIMDRLRLIFLRLRRGKLKLSPSKCEFIATKMMFLGSGISEKGYEAGQNKVKAILNLPFPTSKKKVVHHDLLRYIQPALVEKMVNKYNYKLGVDVPDALTITHSDPAQLDNEKDTLE